MIARRLHLALRSMALIVVVLARVCLAQDPPLPSQAPHRSVLVLYSSNHEGASLQHLRAALNEALRRGSADTLDIQEEFTGLDRYNGATAQAQMKALLDTRYRGRPKDLLVVVGPLALDFVTRNRFLPGVPVVGCLIGAPVLQRARAIRPDLTAVLPERDPLRTADIMLSLYPGTRRVLVVLGASDFERRMTEVAKTMTAPFAGRVAFEYTNDRTLEQIETRVRNLAGDELVFYAYFRQDVTGREFSASHPLARIAAASRRPVFGLVEEDLGEGIVGGVLDSASHAGKYAGELGLRVLGGTAAGSIPLGPAPAAAPAFDWRQLRRWNLPETRLPAGSLVRFRPVNPWEDHWRLILAVLLVILAESLLVVALVVQLKHRRRTERALEGSELRYRTVAEFTHDWEFWQRLDGTFEFLSPACERITGYPAQAFLDEPALMERVVEPEDLDRWRRRQAEALAGTCAGSFEFRLRTAGGELRWVDQVDYPVRPPGGQLAGNRGCIRDISERKRADLARKQAADEIRMLRDQLEAENTFYRARIQAIDPSDELLGGSDAMKYLLFRIRQVAPTDTTVLILGETGTGKELVADAVHRGGRRSQGPLIKVNCATLPVALAESELFGHERGAFTGAHGQRKGRFELADGATLFLDEVAELPLEMQAKLLRILQNGEFQRVGGERVQKVDVRLIAATNRDLGREVAAGRFREDLWYRINVFPITVPPLRARPEDIPELATVFLRRFCQKLGRPELALPNSLVQAFQAYAWPGNVRELENVVERAVLVSEPSGLRLAEPLAAPEPAAGLRGTLDEQLLEFERAQIIRALDQVQGRVEGAQGAARRLGLKPSTLRSRMSRLGIVRA